MVEPVYLDNNATTDLADTVADRIHEALNYWGNPSSNNIYGKRAKEAIDLARRQTAELLRIDEKGLDFGLAQFCWIFS